jgi:hypothetical protein
MGNGRTPPIILNLGTRYEVNDHLPGPAVYLRRTMYSKYHETDTTKVIVLYSFFEKVDGQVCPTGIRSRQAPSTVDITALVPPTVQSNGYGTLSPKENRHIL